MLKPNELTAAAIELNMNPKTFIVMKSAYPDKFQYIYDYDENDFLNAYRLYLADMDEVFKDSKVMYKELKDRRLLNDFSKFVTKKKLYSGRSFANAAKTALFTSTNGISYHSMFLKFKAILAAYPAYIKKKTASVDYQI